MLSSVIRVLTGRAAAVLALLAAVALGTALAFVAADARRDQARLERRIDALQSQLATTMALQKAQAAACVAAADQKRLAAAGDRGLRLLQPPPGFDVCARMESADEAVLDSLG